MPVPSLKFFAAKAIHGDDRTRTGVTLEAALKAAFVDYYAAFEQTPMLSPEIHDAFTEVVRDRAATTIQKIFRGHSVRRFLKLARTPPQRRGDFVQNQELFFDTVPDNAFLPSSALLSNPHEFESQLIEMVDGWRKLVDIHLSPDERTRFSHLAPQSLQDRIVQIRRARLLEFTMSRRGELVGNAALALVTVPSLGLLLGGAAMFGIGAIQHLGAGAVGAMTQNWAPFFVTTPAEFVQRAVTATGDLSWDAGEQLIIAGGSLCKYASERGEAIGSAQSAAYVERCRVIADMVRDARTQLDSPGLSRTSQSLRRPIRP